MITNKQTNKQKLTENNNKNKWISESTKHKNKQNYATTKVLQCYNIENLI